MNSNLKIVFLCLGIIFVGGYKILFPWAPFWVDLSVIAVGILVFLFSSPKEAHPDNEKKSSDNLIGKNDL